MKVLITGAGGQLGKALIKTAPLKHEIHSYNSKDLNICDHDLIHREFSIVRPDVVVNTAAYTAVDLAENEQDAAFSANSLGPAILAEAVKKIGAKLIHISTDFVFDGLKSSPYLPGDKTAPLSVYGKSKLEGENNILHVLGDKSLIIRTSWLYSSHGNNFVKTMLKLMAEKKKLQVVADQIGSPTWTKGLAHVIWKCIEMKVAGIHHWSDSGVTSRYDFSLAIYEEASVLGILLSSVEIKDVSTSDFPTPARRPAFAVLDTHSLRDKIGATPVNWRNNLREMLQEIKGTHNA